MVRRWTKRLRELLKPHGMRDLRSAMRRRIGATEQLEPRWAMAQAVTVTPQFRSDDFSITGTFSYQLTWPAQHDYIDTISAGSYSSTAGHVDWTSPTDGTGYFEGRATGTGRDTVVALGARRTCSDYTIEDIGRLDFTIDAAQSDLVVDQSKANSTRYLSYKDQLAGNCPQPANPWSRFFGGASTYYDGTFKTSDQSVAIKYAQTGDKTMNVTSPAATVKWTDAAATDFSLTAATSYPTPTAPAGWQTLTQSAAVKPVTYLDPESANIALTALMTGKPLSTSTPATPIANVRLFWASSTSDTSGAEIPLTSSGAPVGMFWNSKQLDAVLGALPTAPAGANFIRVSLVSPAGTDANAANNSVYLALGSFEVANPTAGTVAANGTLDGSTLSLLAAHDLADPDIRVFAYNPTSTLGGTLQVLDASGAFIYKPNPLAPQIAALAPGESTTDTVTFLAIKNQTVLDLATHTFTITGINDPPVAGVDSVATNNDHALSISAASLLANDSDPDHNDHVTLSQVDGTSALGATVRLQRDPWTGQISGVTYEPAASTTLQALAIGAQAVDSFTYTIHDDTGLPATGTVQITVTGESRVLRILPIDMQLTRQDVATAPISVQISNPFGPASDVQLSATADNGALVPAPSIVFSGTGDMRTVVITPAAGMTGKTRITVTAQDSASHSTQTEFLLIVGSSTDLDLDGFSDVVEDAAPNGGDMNQDGVPDRFEPHIATGRSAAGDYFQLVVDSGMQLENARIIDPATRAAPPNGMTLPLGIVHFELSPVAAGGTLAVNFRTAPGTVPINRYLHLSTQGVWSDGMESLGRGARVYADHMTLNVVEGGKLDDDQSANGRFVADAGFVTAATPWRGVNPLDVDNDGTVVSLDALIILNEINANGPGPLAPLPGPNSSIPFFYDASDDNFATSLDALLIVNYINSRGIGGEAEGAASDNLGEDQLGANTATAVAELRERGRTVDLALRSLLDDETTEEGKLSGPAAIRPISNRMPLRSGLARHGALQHRPVAEDRVDNVDLGRLSLGWTAADGE